VSSAFIIIDQIEYFLRRRWRRWRRCRRRRRRRKTTCSIKETKKGSVPRLEKW